MENIQQDVGSTSTTIYQQTLDQLVHLCALLACDYNIRVYRTTDTSPFSLVLGQEFPGVVMSEKKRISEKYISMSLVRAKPKVLKNLRLLQRQAESALQKAKELYKRYINKMARHSASLGTKDCVYMDSYRTLCK